MAAATTANSNDPTTTGTTVYVTARPGTATSGGAHTQTTTEVDSNPITTTTDLYTATSSDQIPSFGTEFDATESSLTPDATSRGTLAIHVVPDTLSSVTLLVHNIAIASIVYFG